MKRILSFILLASLHVTFYAQDFYDQSTVQMLEIFFSQSNWDYQMDTAKAGAEGYILADSVRVNGVTFVEVGVKYKGNSSYNTNNDKNPMHINLDYVHEDQHYQHYTDIKLGNGFQDPSNIREVMSYDILSKYMDCPQSNFMNVYINGNLIGLYTNDESINKHFLGGHYYSAESEFFKCNPQGGAGPGGGGYPDLTWQGADSSDYFQRYELKSDFGWNELVDLINTINNNTSELENVLDIDRAIWMLAFNNVLVNLDSYSGQFKQNYYLYKDLNGRWVPTVWDLNMSFGGFPGGNLSVSGMQNLSPTYSNDSNHPLIQKILADPRWQRMYIAHMRTILNENFANGEYLTLANDLMDVIDDDVANDPNAFYTYTQFQSSLTTNVSGGGGGPGGGMSTPGIQVLMDARNTYLQSTTQFTQVPPSITSVSVLSGTPAYGDEVDVQAVVSNATNVFLGYRFDHSHRFYRYEMYDDGQHNDGSSGDGVYGLSFTINSGSAEYYIYAENNNAGIFSPERAEHEFYTIAVTAPAPQVGQLVINEVLTQNTVQEDEYGESDDWVELYNNSNELLDLSNCYLSDDPSDLMRWQFPASTVILPNSYLILWADDDEEQVFRHVNFNLGSSGETLYLTVDGTAIIDSVTYPAQTQDISYGRYPNGTGDWTYMTTTHAAENVSTIIQSVASQSSLECKVFPNPFQDELMITTAAGAQIARLEVMDVSGRTVFVSASGVMNNRLDTSAWQSGTYIMRITDIRGARAIVRLIRS